MIIPSIWENKKCSKPPTSKHVTPRKPWKRTSSSSRRWRDSYRVMILDSSDIMLVATSICKQKNLKKPQNITKPRVHTTCSSQMEDRQLWNSHEMTLIHNPIVVGLQLTAGSTCLTPNNGVICRIDTGLFLLLLLYNVYIYNVSIYISIYM